MDCPEVLLVLQERRQIDTSLECSKCGELGHTVRSCPEDASQAQQAQQQRTGGDNACFKCMQATLHMPGQHAWVASPQSTILAIHLQAR